MSNRYTRIGAFRRIARMLAASFVFALFLTALAIHATPSAAATQEQCENGWATSPAYAAGLGCVSLTIAATPGDQQCQVSAEC